MALDKIPRICQQCGNAFLICTNESRSERRGLFCSRVCFSTSRQCQVERLCDQCGTSFEYPPSQARRFCSRKCSGDYFRVPLSVRFEKYVGQRTESGCLLWVGTLDDNGYGSIWSGPPLNRTLRAHRVAFERGGGIIPDGLDVLHRCDNPPCIEFNHLFTGTQVDNNRDRTAKGRTAKGEANGLTKLLEVEARSIKNRFDGTWPTTKLLADEFRVRPVTVRRIGRGESWAHL